MKEIKTTKILGAIYNSLIRDKIRMKNQMLAGPKINMALQFNTKGEGAYTTLMGKSKDTLLVVLGGKMVSQIAKLPESFVDKEKFKPYFSDIVFGFFGLDYHEMGHVLFTDMKNTSILKYPEVKYRGFLHSLFNMLEDPIIEINMVKLFKEDPSLIHDINPKEFFDLLIERIFLPQCEEYEDDGMVSGFMQYMLLMLRCGKSSIKNKCAVFEKYSTDLLPLIKDVLYEPDGTERIHKSIVLGEWIINNIKEFDWDMPEPEEEYPWDPGAPGGTRASTVIEGDGPDLEDKGPDSSDEGDDEEEKAKKVDDIESMAEDIKDDINDVFNDTIHDGDDHEWIIAKDVCYPRDNSLIEKINERIEKFSNCITDVSKFLKLFKGRIKPREQPGFTRGKLNLFRAMQDDIHEGCDTKIFNQKINRGRDKDLAVSLLCDNSGSMTGLKSHLCTKAALALAQACDWAGIPFECNAFTKTADHITGTCITIVEKSFEDKFEEAKPLFALNDSELIKRIEVEKKTRLYSFCGNSEEINLYYIWKKFNRVNHKTKLLFVMCDGATTGSKRDLCKIVRQIEEEDNIIVIGIGICCSEVAEIYPHHKIFSTTEELETGLAQYLVDTLSEYAV